ncbi:uncharacterized protein LOC113360546 [Papaver somniferum]|uniref:uncharacterized protein LOC113360546 n=1 Tax=Papaver somniferum TaxID=3469 RepID=UPI000E6FFF49|nr:uncharacterized protein LOC113360546 [Papaver somniferum]
MNLKSFWRKIWRMNAIPRVKTFMWKCIHDILPLNERMARILSYINKFFPLCGKNDETLNHILLNCEFTLRVLSQMGVTFTDYTGNHTDFHCWIQDWFHSDRMDNLGDLDWAGVLATICWGIWKCRCDVVFKKINPNPQRIGSKITNIISCNRRSRKEQMLNSPIHIVENTKPLATNLLAIKISITLKINNNSREGGLGLVLAAHAGNISKARCRNIEASSEEELEEEAASMTIQWAQQLNHPRVEIKGDNVKVLEAVGSKIGEMYKGCTQKDIKTLFCILKTLRSLVEFQSLKTS